MAAPKSPAKGKSSSNTRSSGTKAAATSRKSSNSAIDLLAADHKEVKAMFKEFEKLKEREGSEAEKAELVRRICTELTIHTTIEEEIFYPAVREAIDEDDLMDEADVEHASAKEIIAELEAASPGDDHYDAKVTVLAEMIEHHVKEEEDEMFPKARKAIDDEEIGVELLSRKEELMAELAPGEAPTGRAKPSGADKQASK